MLSTGHGQSFKLALMELEVKKDDVKVCCLHDESKNEKQLMEGKCSIVYVWSAIDDKIRYSILIFNI